MAKIVDMGMNHETASVDLRERLASDSQATQRALGFIREMACIKEGLFLTTCNRVETIFTTEDIEEARKSMVSFMSELGEVPENQVKSSLYTLEGMDAVQHILRVTSSLDSMVVGEPQILGQIKAAYAEATRQRTSGVVLNRLMHRAFHAAKRVRTETEICGSAVSISYAAVELAKKIFQDLAGKKVLLLGAGEMAELAARHFLNQGVSTMSVANRTFERAVEVAQTFRASPVYLDEIGSQLLDVDIILASTASSRYVVTREGVKGILRKRRNRPLFFIDIAVPRDIEPEVNQLPNVYVYDIDDLQGVVDVNKAERLQEACKAERIVEEESFKFERWLKTLAVVPTIVSLREKAEAIVQTELKKSGSHLGDISPEQMEAVRTLSRSIAEKILNHPILYLKRRSARPTVNTDLDITRKLFGLDEDNRE